jgi:hypothetical protein
MFDGYVPGVRKVLITIPDGLLAEIDREASVRGASRSAFLQDVARRELSRPSALRLRIALERGRRAFREAPAFESAEEIQAARDVLDAADRRR